MLKVEKCQSIRWKFIKISTNSHRTINHNEIRGIDNSNTELNIHDATNNQTMNKFHLLKQWTSFIKTPKVCFSFATKKLECLITKLVQLTSILQEINQQLKINNLRQMQKWILNVQLLCRSAMCVILEQTTLFYCFTVKNIINLTIFANILCKFYFSKFNATTNTRVNFGAKGAYRQISLVRKSQDKLFARLDCTQ